MITVTRLNGTKFTLNPDLIERLEAHPDTVIHLVSGETYIVRDLINEINDAIVAYRASIIAAALGSHADGGNS